MHSWQTLQRSQIINNYYKVHTNYINVTFYFLLYKLAVSGQQNDSVSKRGNSSLIILEVQEWLWIISLWCVQF